MRTVLFHREANGGEKPWHRGPLHPGPKGNIGHRRALAWALTAVVALPLVGCADSESFSTPTAASAVPAASTPPTPSGPSAIPAGLTSALSEGVTDVTLANAGWNCIQPGPDVILCAPPGTGLPPIPPAANGEPTYNLMAFTGDHQFDHHVKLLRPDLYRGQPCLGGDPWIYLDFLNYYECIIPVRGE